MSNNRSINEELLNYFLESLRDQSARAEGTIANIERDVRAFISFLFDNGDVVINEKFITKYIHELEDKYMESSFLTKLSSLRQFVNWLNLDSNPFWKLKFSVSYDEFDYYQENELFKAFGEEGFSYEELIIRTIYELYLSQEELISFNLENYNMASSCFLCRSMQFSVSTALAASMRQYLKEYRPKLLSDQTQSVTLKDPLFLSLDLADNLRITELDLQHILHERGLKHTRIKRSRIMNLLDQCLTLEEIESKLSLKLSNFYRPFVKERDYRLAKAYSEFHPRAKL